MKKRLVILGILGAATALFSTGAAAHPYGPEYYSFRTVVDLDGRDLRVTTAVEMPTMKVLVEFAARYGHLEEIGDKEDREFFESMLKRVGDGLTVQIDGQPIEGSWTAADSPINGRADERFFYYIVTFEKADALPVGGGQLAVINRVHELDEAYYSGWIRPSSGWQVTESNLNALGNSAQSEDVSEVKEAWSKDAALRNLEARIAPVTGGE
jgi:hypothetical protein